MSNNPVLSDCRRQAVEGGTADVDYAASIAQHTSTPGTGPFQNGSASSASYADFDQSYDPINGLNYQSTASRYTVSEGDTLESIAATVWGDASLWYKIAEANGLNSSAQLVAGMSLVIPSTVHVATQNNTNTYKVYDPNSAIGDTSPTAAKPPRNNKCGMFGQISAAVVAIAATVYLGPVGGNLVSQGFNNLIGWKSLGCPDRPVDLWLHSGRPTPETAPFPRRRRKISFPPCSNRTNEIHRVVR